MELKIRDVAKLLMVSDKTVYRWVRAGAIPAYRVHDQYRVNRIELLEWVTARKMPVSEEIFNEPTHPETPLSLARVLEVGGIYYRVEGADKSSVLRGVVDNMRLPDGVDKEFLYRVLLAREQACSTAVGDGIAIPHPRNPIVLHVTQPSVTLCFLENPVEFGAMDGRPVRVLFTLVSPTVHTHLRTLSRLAFALQDPGFKSAISEPATREVILTEARRLDQMLDSRAAQTNG
ncbi:MAG: PTS sugar transporter subunit IIA [Candidatus Hydrogenedentes bacterium]|nr:PTS sugar transporter subunit IIA [Candidatus Hydrogenedentota bacterium]